MRPHRHDHEHNLEVGRAFRKLVNDLFSEGWDGQSVDRCVGEHVNAVAQAAYDLGVNEVQPSMN